MAIDPQFISLADLEDFAALGGEARLEADLRAQLDLVRAASTVDYTTVRTLKHAVLRRSFARFREEVWDSRTQRGRVLSCATCTTSHGGWMNTPSFARCTHGTTSDRGASGPSPFAIGSPERWRRRVWSWPTTSSTGSTCSGWPPTSGPQRAGPLAPSRSGVTCRSWSAATAPTYGRARTSSGSTRRLACLPMRSARRDRIGTFPPIAGTSSPPAATDGCGIERDATRRSSTAIGSITSWASIGPISVPTTEAAPGSVRRTSPHRCSWGSRVLQVLREPGSEVIAEDLGVVPHFRSRVARAAGYFWLQGVSMGAPVGSRGTAVSRSGRLSRAVDRHLRHARH